MIILTEVVDALRLYEGGVVFPQLNIGGLRAKESARRLTKAVALSAEDEQTLAKLDQHHVEIYFQMVPRDEKYSYEKIMKEEQAHVD